MKKRKKSYYDKNYGGKNHIIFVENIRVTEYNKRWSIGCFMEDNNS